MTPLPDSTAYLAPQGYVAQLREELGDVIAEFDRLLVAPGSPRPAAWAANVWRAPVRLAIASIGDGARALRAVQRNWAHYPYVNHRRAALLQEKLPHVAARPLHFAEPAPSAPLGSWTLLDKDTLFFAADCSSAFPNGEAQFVEDKDAPPNRAYLKLWEACTLLGAWPSPGERCVDLGASPGGWTSVLASRGVHVVSVDKARLDPRVAALPNVEFRQQSAFALDPAELGPVDWLCCDVACYPERLLRLVHRWLAAGTVRRFVCTLKFQGATDHATAAEFAAIPGSRLVHLHHNRHELTWLRGTESDTFFSAGAKREKGV